MKQKNSPLPFPLPTPSPLPIYPHSKIILFYEAFKWHPDHKHLCTVFPAPPNPLLFLLASWIGIVFIAMYCGQSMFTRCRFIILKDDTTGLIPHDYIFVSCFLSLCIILYNIIMWINLTTDIHWVLRMDSWGHDRKSGYGQGGVGELWQSSVLGSCLVGWPGKKYTYTHTHIYTHWAGEKTWPEQLLTIETVYVCFV